MFRILDRNLVALAVENDSFLGLITRADLLSYLRRQFKSFKNYASSIRNTGHAVGGIAGPFNSFLALRGLKTLHLRMERHRSNPHQLTDWLR